MNRMRHVTAVFGVTEESQPLVEALYTEYLDAFNAHFEQYPTFWAGNPVLAITDCSHPCMRIWEEILIRRH